MSFLWTFFQIYYLIGVAVMIVIYTKASYIDRLMWRAEKDKRDVSRSSINIGIIVGTLLGAIFWIPSLIVRIKKGKAYGMTNKEEKTYRKDRGDKAIT